MKYDIRGVWASRGFDQQRADVYAIDKDGEHYAFHEWTIFPKFGEIIAHALSGGKVGKAECNVSYWMIGPNLPTKDEVMKHCEGCGSFRPEEDPYPPEGQTRYFPVALDFESAVSLYERDRLHIGVTPITG